jgi:hypothetical protein
MFTTTLACVPAGDSKVLPAEEQDIAVGETELAGCVTAPISAEESSGHQRIALRTVAASAPAVVYLNRLGGTYSPGANDSATNRSSIVSRSYTIPAYSRGDASWTRVVACVREQFAAYNVAITEVEPGAGNYVEAVVAGHPSQIGLQSGIGGIAPIDTYSCRPIERAIAFVFERNLGNDQHLCEIVAHEVGHTISLEHEYKCQDPMTYLTGCGNKTFQNSSEWCGTYAAERCACRGGQQNTHAALLNLLGPSTGMPPPDTENDREPPRVVVTSPNDGAILAENQPLEVVASASDDLQLARVDLLWDFNGETYPCPSTLQYVSCVIEADLYRWTLRVGTGTRSFRVRAADVAGKETTTASQTLILTPGGQPPPDTTDRTPPVIAVAAPANVPPRSRIVIEAELTDDSSVERAILNWAFNGSTYPCPTNQQYVTCTVSANTYTWSVEVTLEGARSFTVVASDPAGNEAVSPQQTVNVAAVQDRAAPTVAVDAPEPTYPANSTVLVTATISDDIGVTSASLEWDFNGLKYPCPHASQFVDCAIEGERYTWVVRAGTGPRVYRVRASDASGKTAASSELGFVLQ